MLQALQLVRLKSLEYKNTRLVNFNKKRRIAFDCYCPRDLQNNIKSVVSNLRGLAVYLHVQIRLPCLGEYARRLG